jgi:hypothetical protein
VSRALKVASWAGGGEEMVVHLRGMAEVIQYVVEVESIMKLLLDDALEVRFSDVERLAPPCGSTDIQVLSNSTHIKLM